MTTPATASHERLGVVGLGRLGLAVGRHLVGAGHEVSGFDVDARACSTAAAAGVRVQPSPAALAAASRACLVLVGDDDDVLDACVRGTDPLLAGMGEGDAIIVCATVLPATVQAVARAAQGLGVDVLDAPLARGEQAVDRGDALLLGGGDPAVLARWRPVLASFCSDVIHLGDVGAGQVAKMVNNLLLWSAIAANHEGLRLAQRFGVDLAALREGLLLGSGRNWALETWERPRDMPWAAKDLQIILDSGEAHSVPAPVAEAVRAAIASIRSQKLAWQDRSDRPAASMAEFIAGTDDGAR